MAQEIEVGMLARLTSDFIVAEVLDDTVDAEDYVHFIRGTVVKVLHVFEKEGCPKQAVIYSDVLKEATSCALSLLEPMKVIDLKQPKTGGYIAGGVIKTDVKISF